MDNRLELQCRYHIHRLLSTFGHRGQTFVRSHDGSVETTCCYYCGIGEYPEDALLLVTCLGWRGTEIVTYGFEGDAGDRVGVRVIHFSKDST
jgi:hypothetical protein